MIGTRKARWPLWVRMWLWFGGVWFYTQAVDALWPPGTPIFDVGISLLASLCCLAREWERSKG